MEVAEIIRWKQELRRKKKRLCGNSLFLTKKTCAYKNERRLAGSFNQIRITWGGAASSPALPFNLRPVGLLVRGWDHGSESPVFPLERRGRAPRGPAPPMWCWPRWAEPVDANEPSYPGEPRTSFPSLCQDRRNYAPSLTMSWLSNSQAVVLTATLAAGQPGPGGEPCQGGEEAASR